MPCIDEDEACELIEGALDPATRRDVEHHIERCDGCRRLIATLAELATTGGPGERPGAEPELELGARIGRYRICERIAGGGMGVVYRAYDPELDRDVALKLVSAIAADGEPAARAERRLRDEARALARIAHPNVLAVHDAGIAGGAVFLATEIVEGETLASWLEPVRGWREVVRLFADAGRGLAAAHAAGIVHRDFKPANVLVGRDGRARLGDFGLAIAGDGAADTGPVGTRRYMAPEQRAGGAVDARSDQYSFAVALSDALRGARVPRRLRAAIARARQSDPAARFASVAELVAELDAALAGRGRAGIAVAVACALAVAAAIALSARRPAADAAGPPPWLGSDEAALFRAADTAARAREQFADATARARATVDDAVARHGPLAAATARAHNGLGIALFLSGDRAAARDQFRLAIAGAIASGDPDVASYLAQLAHTLPDDDAIPVLERALAMEQARSGQVVTRLCDLAAIHRDAGRIDRARELAGRALAEARARRSADDVDDATAMLATIEPAR